MAEKLTIEQMKRLVQRLESARSQDVGIPQAYLDRLEKSAQLLDVVRKMPAIDWDNLTTAEDVERAEALNDQKLELKSDIERHLTTCGLSVSHGNRSGRKGATAGRTRQPRRSREQIEYDLKLAEITKNKKAELGLPSRGRLTADDKGKLESAIEKEIKKQKLTAPAGH